MYEQYERKMQGLRKRLIVGAVIFTAILLCAAAVCCMLCYRGYVVEELSCRNVTYGNAPAPEAKVRFGTLRYEYREMNGGDWSTERPWKCGSYEVRAIITARFGKTRVIGTKGFKIEPKALTLKGKKIEQYAPLPRDFEALFECEVEGLVYGDVVTDISMAMLIGDETSRYVPYMIDTWNICHEDGTSADNCYAVNTQDGYLKDIREKLVIQAESKTITYNGDPNVTVTCDEFQLIYGTLAPGHTISAHCIGEQVGIGDCRNNVDLDQVFIFDNDGKVVNDRYIISTQSGLLSFKKRPLALAAASATKVYDGKPLFKQEYTIKSGYSLAEGDHLKVVISGTRTEPGQSSNVISEWKVLSDTYGDVSGCYEVFCSQGQLVVESPDQMFITADPDQFSLSDGRLQEWGEKEEGTASVVFRFLGQQNRSYYFKEYSYAEYTGRGWHTNHEPEEQELYPYSPYLPAMNLMNFEGAPDVVRVKDLRIDHWAYPYYMSSEAYPVAGNEGEYEALTYVPTREIIPIYDELNEEYRDYVYANYTSISDDLKEELLSLGKQNGIRAYDSDLIHEIAFYIQNAAVYNLQYAPFPSGVDMVTYFLKVSKEGICQHYAAAATMMYRAYGIPARFVVGFMEEGKANRWTDMTTKRGHAWVEVYVDGFGWAPVEVTGSSGDAGVPGGEAGFAMDENHTDDDWNQEMLIIGFSGLRKQYDGKGVDFQPEPYVLSGKLPEGTRLEASASMIHARAEVGEYYSQDVRYHIIDRYGNDIKDVVKHGVLSPEVSIVPRRIVVSTFGYTGTIDEGGVSTERWFISSGSLANGDRAQILMSESRYKVGTSLNRPVYFHVLDENGRDVTDMYSIDIQSGLLEIK